MDDTENDRLAHVIVVMLCFWAGLMVGLVLAAYILGYA